MIFSFAGVLTCSIDHLLSPNLSISSNTYKRRNLIKAWQTLGSAMYASDCLELLLNLMFKVNLELLVVVDPWPLKTILNDVLNLPQFPIPFRSLWILIIDCILRLASKSWIEKSFNLKLQDNSSHFNRYKLIR